MKPSNFITEFPINPKEFKVDTTLQCVEAESDRWVSSNSNFLITTILTR